MKRLTTSIVLAALCVISAVGCKSLPTDDKMYVSSYAVGASTGLIADMTKIDDTSRDKVIDIVNIVNTHVPQTNETFTEAWTPIADSYIERLVKSGEIDVGQGILISKTFDIICNGIDYVFIVRYPKARQYQELVEAATHGFSDGFLDTFKPVNALFSTGDRTIEIDKDVYKYLSTKYLK